MALRDDLVAHGWCQGSLVREQDNPRIIEYLAGFEVPLGSRFMIVTQVCDLLHPSLVSEPIAEVLLVTVVQGNPDGNFVNCRSTRKLHIPVTLGEAGPLHLQACRTDVKSIPRQVLQDLEPDANLQLDKKSVLTLQRWMALRYSRAALPDSFEGRAGPARNEIRKALKQVPHDIDALYVALNSHDELPDGTPYTIALYGIMRVDNYSDGEKRTRASTALEKLAGLLNGCAGIDVLEYAVQSAADVSLDDVEDLVLWNFDDLSLGANPQAAPPGQPAL